MLMDDGDLRMLGARDGVLHALLDVRQKIARYDHPYRKINPRHTRKIAERDRIVAPLRDLEKHFQEQLDKLNASYQATRKPKAA